MFQNNQQQSQLPFRVDAPQWQYLQINYQALPFVPQVNVVPWLNQYVPLITGALMGKIQHDAQIGPISMAMFNWMAADGFRNQQFAALVADVADYIFIENQNYVPPPQQIEQVVERGIAGFMQMRVLGLLLDFPALATYINPADRAVIDQTINAYRGYVDRIGNMRRSTPQNVGYGQPVGQPQQQWGQPQQQWGGQQQQAPMRPQGHQPYTIQGQSTYAAAGPGYPNQGFQPGRPQDASGGRDYGGVVAQVHGSPNQFAGQQQAPQQYSPPQPLAQSSAIPPFAPRKETTMEQSAAAPINYGNVNLVEIEDATWHGNKQFPYPYAFNPVIQKQLFQVETDNSTTPLIQEGNLNVIDYDRHSVASLFGKPPVGMPVQRDPVVVNSALQKGVKVIAEDSEKANASEGETKIDTIYTAKNLLGETSLSSAWLTSQIQMMASADPMPMVYRVYARIYTPVLGWDDESEHILNLSKAYSYIELHAKLAGMAEEVSPAFVTLVNQRMTEHVNHILHKKLSISPTELTITDFLADLPEVLASLKANYGDDVVTAFNKEQRKEIAALFQTLDPTHADDKEMVDVLNCNLLADAGGEWEGKERKPCATYMASTYSLTLIDVLSHDLQVAGVEGVGNALLKKYQPALFELALNIMEANAVVGQGDIYRHLIRTRDGRVLEVTKGSLGSEFLLLSLVK